MHKMKYLYLMLLSLLTLSSFAQATKAYITKEGNYSADPQTAIGYVIIQKLQDDSAYMVNQYDMHDTIQCKGFYKDAMLTIPNGKFVYFEKPDTHNPHNNYGSDTNNYVQKVGNYSNGKQIGLWREYTYDKKISKEYNYENGLLNGSYKTYFNDYSGKWSEAHYVNDLLEGSDGIFTGDSTLMAESIFEHNKFITKKVYLYEASPPDNFVSFLEKRLKKYQPELRKAGTPYVKLTIDTTGRVLDADLVKEIKPELDKAIIAAILQSPLFYPATYNGNHIVQKIVLPLGLFNEEESKKFEDYMRQQMLKH